MPLTIYLHGTANQTLVSKPILLLFCHPMRLALIFVYLSLFLLKGYDPAPATATAVRHSHTISHNAGTDAFDSQFLCDDLEEDDPDNLFARKFRLMADGHSALSLQSLLSHDYSISKTPQPFNGQASCKYIIQRVLRV